MNDNESFVYKIYRKKTINRFENKIKLLGSNCNYNVFNLLNTRLVVSILIFITFWFAFDKGFIIAPVCTILFYKFYEYFILDRELKKRSQKLENEAIFYFESLNLSLENSKNLKSSLELVSNNIEGELSIEFKKTLAEVKIGKSFTESLNSMKERIPSDVINNMILCLSQSSLYENSLKEALTKQINYLNQKRIYDVKIKISNLPLKIGISIFFLFIPFMYLILVSSKIITVFLG